MKIFILAFILVFKLFGEDTMGQLLFEGNCVTCHSENEEKSAPSMMEVKKRYKTAFSNKENFIEYLSEWVSNPSAQHSIMLDAIRKHGLMPQLGYEKEVLKEIAAYIYEHDFSKKDPAISSL
jgi:cytochrome c551/c552